MRTYRALSLPAALLLLVLVVIGGSASSVGVASPPPPPLQDPCLSIKSNFSSWMGDLSNYPSIQNTFSSRRLNEILIGGTHDAGLWTVQATGIAAMLPSSFFKTQEGDYLYQLCLGNRWFDTRIDYIDNTFKLFHGSAPLVAYGGTLDNIIQSVTQFLSYPRYSKEILVWRIKLGPSVTTSVLASDLRQRLSEFIVDKVSPDDEIQGMQIDAIWNQKSNQTGHLVLMSYGWTPPPVEIGQRQGWFWDYRTAQLGEYSDAVYLSGMLNRCSYGQVPRLLEYKALVSFRNTTNYPLIGIWWTFTTGDVWSNTVREMNNNPTSLYDFYLSADGEIGNVLIVDFFGYFEKSLMDIVWTYNYNKYVAYPPQAPTKNLPYNTTSPSFPGQVFTGGPCENLGSATTNFTTTVIAVFSVIVILIIVTIIALIAFIYIKCCKVDTLLSHQNTFSMENCDEMGHQTYNLESPLKSMKAYVPYV